MSRVPDQGPHPGTGPVAVRARLRQRLVRFAPGRLAYRLRVLAGDRRMAMRRPTGALRYLARSRELTNFTYELENEAELAPFLARALGASEAAVGGALAELDADAELHQELAARLRRRDDRDDQPRYGKRRAVYALIRVARPRVLVETGTHDGLGAAVALRALERNEREGSAGKLLAFDLDPESGWLIDTERHGRRLERVIGDIRETLGPALEADGVDVLIHDSLIEPDLERFELETALSNSRSPALVLMSLEGHTGALAAFAAEHGASAEAFQERPLHHYWRGNELVVTVLGALSTQLPFA